MIGGEHTPLQPPVNDIDILWGKQEKYTVNQMLKYVFVDGPAYVKKDLQSFCEVTLVDEVMAVSHIYEHAERLRSY